MASESLQILIEAINEASGPIREVEDALEQMQSAARNTMEVGERLTNFGDQFTNNVSRPILQGLGASTNAAIELESVMSDTNKALGIQPNTEGAAALNTEIMSLSRELGQMPTAIADFYTEAGKLGIVRDQMDDYTRIVNQAGVAWDMTSTQAGEAVSVLSNVMGLFDAQTGMVDLEGLTALGDTINYLADTGATSEAAIASVLQRSGSTMRMFGLLNDESAALATGFLNLGYPPEVVGTALNGMLPMLSNATQQTQGFQDALESIGLPASQFEQMVRQDATGAIMELMDAATASGNTGIWQQLFGTGSDSAMLAAASQNLDNFRNTLDSIENVQPGGMLQSYENRLQTTAAQMERFRSTMFQVGATVGAAILPALNGLLDIVTPIAAGFADFAAAHPGIVQIGVAIAAVVAAVGPLIVGLGMVVSAVGAISAAFAAGGVLTGIAAAISGAFAAIAAIGAGPILAVIGVIAAGAYLIIDNWSAISTFFQNLFSSVKAYITDFMSGLMTGLEPAMPAIQSLKESFSSIWQSISQASGALLELGGTIGGIVLEFLKLTPAGQLIQQVGSALMRAGGSASSFGERVGAAIAVAIQGAARVAAGFSRLVGVIGRVMTAIINRIRSAAQAGFAAGRQIVQRIADGIRAGIGAVSSAVSSVVNRVRSMLPGSPVKTGPLTVLNQISQNPGAKIAQMVGAGIASVDLGGYLAPALQLLTPPELSIPQAIAPSVPMLSSFRSPMPQIGASVGIPDSGAGIAPTVGETPSAGASITVTIENTFNIGEGTNIQDFERALEEHQDALEQALEAIAHKHMRVSYG